MFFFQIIIRMIINQGFSLTGYLRHGAHTSYYLHRYPLKRKRKHKKKNWKKNFQFQPLQALQDLAQHLKIRGLESILYLHIKSLIGIIIISSFELNHSAYFIAQPCLDIGDGELYLHWSVLGYAVKVKLISCIASLPSQILSPC